MNNGQAINGALRTAGAKDVVVAATFKVLVLGDSCVGKTSVISRYATGAVPLRMIATIGKNLLCGFLTARIHSIYNRRNGL